MGTPNPPRPAFPQVSSLVDAFDQLAVADKSRFLDAALTDDQLEVAYLRRQARRRTTEPSYVEEHERITQQADPETCRVFAALTAPASWVDHLGECGIDDEFIACAIARGHMVAGESIDEAVAAVWASGISWTPRTTSQREEAVVRGMLADGFPAEVVRQVLAGEEQEAA